MIDWLAFLQVLITALIGGCAVVCLYALGLRMLAVAGRTPFVPPREFEEAITVLSPKQVKKETKKIRKARKHNPYSPAVKRLALAAAWALFILCGLLVLLGIILMIPYFSG